jgi:hypothetical protein
MRACPRCGGPAQELPDRLCCYRCGDNPQPKPKPPEFALGRDPAAILRAAAMSHRIEGLDGPDELAAPSEPLPEPEPHRSLDPPMRRRKPQREPPVRSKLRRYQRPRGLGRFEHLPPELRPTAQRSLWKWCKRWKGNLTRARYSSLCAAAAKHALHPLTSEKARSMQAARGGYAVQRVYVREGRTGRRHPARRAAVVSAASRRFWKQKRGRERLGLAGPPRIGQTDLSGALL